MTSSLATSVHSTDIRPPVARGLPWIGNGLDMMRNPLQFLRKRHQSLGPIFRVTAGKRDITVLAGLEANRYVALDGRDNFSSQETWGPALEALGCPHLFIGIDGDAHQYQRKLLKPSFSKAAFKERLPELAQPTLDIVQGLQERNTLVAPLLRRIVSHQVGSILQGTRPSGRQIEDFVTTQNTILNIYLLGKWPRVMMLRPAFLRATLTTRAFTKQLVRTAAMAANTDSSHNYLAKILEGQVEHPAWFTPGDIRGHALVPFVLGLDTVAATLGFMLYELLKQPALMKRIRREIDPVFQQGVPTYEALDALEDLKGMVFETLRMYPVAFGLNRYAAQDFTFQGYSIHKGDHLLVFTAANHFDPDYFPNPDRFDIERYRSPRNEHKQNAVFAPFGRGTHACIGSGLAELQLMMNLGLLLHHCDIRAATSMRRVKMIFDPAPTLSRNFRVHVRPRSA